MKVIILAGGKGTRLSEETITRPKPMIEIGTHPVLWHIMMIYASQGFNEFLIACGYKGEMIKEYFNNFFIRSNDYFIDLKNGQLDVIKTNSIDWNVGVFDTGLESMTGGRIKYCQPWIEKKTFMVTYGDGVGNVDVRALLAFHQAHGKTATVTAVRPPARFGGLVLDGDHVERFSEKPQTGEGWINGGFFVFEPEIFQYLDQSDTVLEREPLEKLAGAGELVAFRHEGFWQPMDTLREKQYLESLWLSGEAPWKIWK